MGPYSTNQIRREGVTRGYLSASMLKTYDNFI